jgi:hypothetical protein
MAQATDYALANQSGANFRAELNSILAAIVTNNSGSTAPSTTYAYQPWVDTGVSPALLKLRNGANTDWVTVGDVTAANLGLLTQAAAASTYLALAGGTVTGTLEIGSAGSFRFEGSTPNDFETAIAVVDPTADRTITLPDETLTVAGRNVLQTFSAAQRGSVVALTDGATITPDFAGGNFYSVTLGGNRTLANPSNIAAGQSGVIVITQDGTGGRTLAYGSYWKFPGGTAPTLTTTAAAVDVLAWYAESTTRITARLISDVK